MVTGKRKETEAGVKTQRHKGGADTAGSSSSTMRTPFVAAMRWNRKPPCVTA